MLSALEIFWVMRYTNLLFTYFTYLLKTCSRPTMGAFSAVAGLLVVHASDKFYT